MVRKREQALGNPPYPDTPIESKLPTSLALAGDSEEQSDPPTSHIIAHSHLPALPDGPRSRSDSESYSIDTGSEWDSEEDIVKVDHDVPAPLSVRPKKSDLSTGKDSDALPAPLRVGPPDGVVRRSLENERIPDRQQVKSNLESPQPNVPMPTGSTDYNGRSMPFKSHNPYLRVQTTGDPTASALGNQGSTTAWPVAGNSGDTHGQISGYMEPAELPAANTPVEQLSKLEIHDGSQNPSGYGVQSPHSDYAPLIPVNSELPNTNIQPITSVHLPQSSGPAFSETPNPWANATAVPETDHTYQLQAASLLDQDVWQTERDGSQAAQQYNSLPDPKRADAEPLISIEPEDNRFSQVDSPPQVPPRVSLESEETSSAKASRPTINTSQASSAAAQRDVETPRTKANRQRSEHYQIKRIRWQDPSGQLRQSPILTQNANGPCPLLALVNALVLSTPVNTETALVEALRTREQVSLGLLLDAVFDELTSGRRGDVAQELPDVGDLYAFLITLHTGMNVNPRLISPAAEPQNIMDSDLVGLSDIHPAHQDQVKPGTFEETREMRLYGTFGLPLVHGWLPAGASPAYEAFSRVAKTYEDAQNVLFHEEALEEKLRTDGLSQEEQQLLQDINTIKDFLSRWPTQLTDFGLSIIDGHLLPGQISILFRNDHFLTLYKEPHTQRLYTLITDAGYASHEEVVWESLTDVNGQGSEIYSGDFRPVGNSEAQISSPVDARQGWTTVESRNRGQRLADQRDGTGHAAEQRSQAPNVDSAGAAAPVNSSNTTEQEDHDLALALQLQEEEEDRHRREEARRRREEQLSRQFLSSGNEGRQEIRPLIPPRRNNVNTGVNRPSASQDAVPPPTYQQAASDVPYNPQVTTHPPRLVGQGRGQSAYPQQSAGISPAVVSLQQSRRRRGSRIGPLVDQIPDGLGGSGRRRPNASTGVGGPSHAAGDDRDRCVIM